VQPAQLRGARAQRRQDQRGLKLLRGVLPAGGREGGLGSPTEEGTPPGGPLSPLGSPVVLDERATALDRRGHRVVRDADERQSYVRSRRAGERVMQRITRFIARRLQLVVNAAKRAGARPWERQRLGCRVTRPRAPPRRIAPQAVKRFTKRRRTLTQRTRGPRLEPLVEQGTSELRGGHGACGFWQTPSGGRAVDAWPRRRLRR
jgi:RNA-directed DNA polymerase